MTSQKNVRNLILGKSLTVGTGVPAVGTQVEPSNMANGAVAITDLSGKRITTLASGEGLKGFCVVQGQGADKPLIKHSIKPSNITGAYLKNYSAATEQVSYIGSNGTTGSLPAGAVDTTYYGAVVLQGEFLTFGAREMKKTFDYKCTTSDSTADVAAGLALSIYNGVARMADPYYKVERVATTTSVAAFTGTAVAIKLSKGSKTVAFVDSAGAASTGTAAVGNVVNLPSTNGTSFTFTALILGTAAGSHVVAIGNTLYTVADAGSAAQNATAIAAAINAGTQATATVSTADVTIQLLPTTKPTTVSVYDTNGTAAIAVTINTGDATPVKYVVASGVTAGASFTLDLPWTGESCIVFEGTTAASMAGVATLSGATPWGLKLTGLPRTYEDITFRFYKIRFAVELFNMGSTTSTLSVAANEGSGMSEAVQWLESFTVGNEGAYYVIQPDQPLARRKNSLNYIGSGQGWNLITINYYDETTNNIIGGQKMEKSLTIAGVTGTNTQFSDSTGILGIIESIPAIGDTLGTWA
jgi:hypothetical protein